jgi:hypothetical protein
MRELEEIDNHQEETSHSVINQIKSREEPASPITTRNSSSVMLWIALGFFVIVLALVYNMQRGCSKNAKRKRDEGEDMNFGMKEFE